MYIIRNRVCVQRKLDINRSTETEYKSRLNSRDKIHVESILSIIIMFWRIHWILSNGE